MKKNIRLVKLIKTTPLLIHNGERVNNHIMKISCSKSALMNGISIVSKAVASKSTMPITQCILVEASLCEIRLIANDTELGIETTIEGDIKEAGCVALDAKLFGDIIRKLPDSEIIIETSDNHQTLIRCERSKCKLPGLSGDTFNYLPEIERTNSFSVSQLSLKESIHQTIFSVAMQSQTNILTGELFEVANNTLKIVALDGHRIAIRKIELSEDAPDTKVIIPGKALAEISKILSGGSDDKVTIYTTPKHVLFEFDNTKIVSRLIEGDYYKVEQMLSNDYETTLSINKSDFMDCIDRSLLFVRESEKKPLILNIENEYIHLNLDTALGSMNEEIEIKKTGKDLKIGFNPRFLSDALRVIEDDEVNLYMINSKSPCIIRNEDSTYIYLILPVSIAA